MGYRETGPETAELFCMRCNACCIALGKRILLGGVRIFDAPPMAAPQFVAEGGGDIRFAIELRPYQKDPRFKRDVNAGKSEITLADGRIVSITEYAATCSEQCSEALDDSWTRNDEMPSPWKKST